MHFFFSASCPSGTHYEVSTQTCEKCIVGEYQDEHGQITCESCPLGKTTKNNGSKTANDCVGKSLHLVKNRIV